MNQMFSCLPRPYPPKTLQTVISDTGTSSSPFEINQQTLMTSAGRPPGPRAQTGLLSRDLQIVWHCG